MSPPCDPFCLKYQTFIEFFNKSISYQETDSFLTTVMSETKDSQVVTAGPSGVDGAVGVQVPHWFVAVVNSRHEKAVDARLKDLGVTSYVATQSEMRVWANGRRKLVERVVIPARVFIKCSEKQRLDIVRLPFIQRFMVNRAVETGGLNKPVAIIPDLQMDRLAFMLGQSDALVEFDPMIFKVNDNVRVLRGPLRGLEGEIVKNPDGSHSLTVGLDILGGARITVDPRDVEKIIS